MVRKARAKSVRDGRLPMKYRWDSHLQSDDPNPAMGMDAPRCKLRQCAHRHSHEMRSQQNQTSSGFVCARR